MTPATNKMDSKIKLKQQGTSKSLILKIMDTIIIKTIIDRIKRLIFLYFFFSSGSNGFAGVSCGENTTIVRIARTVNPNMTLSLLDFLEMNIKNATPRKENVVSISHFVSLFEWYPPAKVLIARNGI